MRGAASGASDERIGSQEGMDGSVRNLLICRLLKGKSGMKFFIHQQGFKLGITMGCCDKNTMRHCEIGSRGKLG